MKFSKALRSWEFRSGGRSGKQERMANNCSDGKNTQTAVNRANILNCAKSKKKKTKIKRSDSPKENLRAPSRGAAKIPLECTSFIYLHWHSSGKARVSTAHHRKIDSILFSILSF